MYKVIPPVDPQTHRTNDPATSSLQNYSVFTLGVRDQSQSINNEQPEYYQKHLIRTKTTSIRKGWMNFDLKHQVRRWLQHPSKKHGIAINCEKGCKTAVEDSQEPIDFTGDLKPFIFIKTAINHRRIRKRSAYRCTGQNERRCCMSSFTINFHDIGWDWVIEPRDYQVNYCAGSCYGNVNAHFIMYTNNTPL